MSSLMERCTNVPGKEVWEMTLSSWHSIEKPGGAAQLSSLVPFGKPALHLGLQAASVRSRDVCPNIQRRLKVCGCSCFYPNEENACKV